jgi:hypothetical protein
LKVKIKCLIAVTCHFSSFKKLKSAISKHFHRRLLRNKVGNFLCTQRFDYCEPESGVIMLFGEFSIMCDSTRPLLLTVFGGRVPIEFLVATFGCFRKNGAFMFN